MPRGVPKNGFRAPRNGTAAADRLANLRVSYESESKRETDAEIDKRIGERFEILDILTEACITGFSRSLIVSGAPGIGKSYGVEKALEKMDNTGESYEIIKGYTRPTGLIKLLYRYRHSNNIVVFDDADSVFHDDVGLNILKCVADTTERRVVSWLSEGSLIDEDTAERIPRSFEFKGSVLFLTNLDFETLIGRGHKIAPHLEALMSRSHYLDLSMKTRRDYLVRMRQVLNQGMLSDLSFEERSGVITFLERNYETMRELSLRAAIKLGNLRKCSSDWEKIASITMLKQ